MLGVEAKIKEGCASISRFWPQARQWAVKGGWAVLDQGLFSGANFLVNILLARWLAPEEYGAFAVALSIFYFLAAFHTAVLTEPMMVFGAGKYREQFRKYLGMLFWAHWGISAMIALELGGAAWFFLQRDSPLGKALLGLAVALPFLLLLWLTRRACYANLRPAWAVGGSALNLLVVLAGLLLLWRAGFLSTLTGLVLLGAAAGAASLVLTTVHLRPRVWGFSGNPTLGMVMVDHQDYGKWNVLGVLARWGSNRMLLFVVPLVFGLQAAAGISASTVVMKPIQQFVQSLSTLILPYLSRQISKSYSDDTPDRDFFILLILPLSVVLYGVTISCFSRPIIHWLYGGKYDMYWWAIPIIALNTLLTSCVGVLSLLLKSMLRVKIANRLLVVAAVAFLASVWPLARLVKLPGALLSAGIGQLVAFVWGIWVLRRESAI